MRRRRCRQCFIFLLILMALTQDAQTQHPISLTQQRLLQNQLQQRQILLQQQQNLAAPYQFEGSNAPTSSFSYQTQLPLGANNYNQRFYTAGGPTKAATLSPPLWSAAPIIVDYSRHDGGRQAARVPQNSLQYSQRTATSPTAAASTAQSMPPNGAYNWQQQLQQRQQGLLQQQLFLAQQRNLRDPLEPLSNLPPQLNYYYRPQQLLPPAPLPPPPPPSSAPFTSTYREARRRIYAPYFEQYLLKYPRRLRPYFEQEDYKK